MKSLAVCSLLALLAAPCLALEPYLVQDINPVPQPESSSPSELVRLGDAILFFAEDAFRDRELWRSDGTAAGTFPLSEICDDPSCHEGPLPFLLTERLYFFLAASAPESQRNLWVSDGTPGGTFPLTGPDVDAYPPERLWVASQGVLYFVAEDGEHGEEIWRTDGTPAGTWLLADIRPGTAGSGVQGLKEYRNRVWFGADDGQRGGSLWSTDGTPGGTALALDPVPSSVSHPAPEHLQVLGNRLTFFALAPGGGQQLWVGDGTAKRTAPVTKLAGGKRPSVLHDST
ncbi:MAG TPA: ELWxxDGT repeat protein, partial [Thermoanaerobaculia bacterium]|nr:ELWxxDGT repeat protein [Thermoanaerobaculia bacterium]